MLSPRSCLLQKWSSSRSVPVAVTGEVSQVGGEQLQTDKQHDSGVHPPSKGSAQPQQSNEHGASAEPSAPACPSGLLDSGVLPSADSRQHLEVSEDSVTQVSSSSNDDPHPVVETDSD